MDDTPENNPWLEVGSGTVSDIIPQATTTNSHHQPEPSVSPDFSSHKKPMTNPKTHEDPFSTQRISKKVAYINGRANDIVFGVALVNFHHIRGPEVEYVKIDPVSSDRNFDVATSWPVLPFQALPDGAHAFEESFSYFTLEYQGDEKTNNEPTTIFAISCARQIRSNDLIERDSDVTRSSVQKSLVVLLREPIYGVIQEKLSIVTKSFFEQKNFGDKVIIDLLYDNLRQMYTHSHNFIEETDFTTGLDLQGLIKAFQKNTLTILKAMILERRIVFYSTNSTDLCKLQLSFISLIPNLINSLRDSASPDFNKYIEVLKLTTSFQTSDRNSVLSFAGLPLQIFGQGGIFNPYCALQQFESLNKCQFYTIGSSNAMVVNNKLKMADVLVNIDTASVEIITQELFQALSLTSMDKKWIQNVHQSVVQSTHTTFFTGNDDYIRLQFEDYLLGLLSTVKFLNFVELCRDLPPEYKEYDNNQSKHFNKDFIKLWKKTLNYKAFEETTDDHIFDVFEPKHVFYDTEMKSSLSEKFHDFYKKTTASTSAIPTITSNKHSHQELGLKSNSKEDETIQDTQPADKRNPFTGGKLWGWYNRKKSGN